MKNLTKFGSNVWEKKLCLLSMVFFLSSEQRKVKEMSWLILQCPKGHPWCPQKTVRRLSRIPMRGGSIVLRMGRMISKSLSIKMECGVHTTKRLNTHQNWSFMEPSLSVKCQRTTIWKISNGSEIGGFDQEEMERLRSFSIPLKKL